MTALTDISNLMRKGGNFSLRAAHIVVTRVVTLSEQQVAQDCAISYNQVLLFTLQAARGDISSSAAVVWGYVVHGATAAVSA